MSDFKWLDDRAADPGKPLDAFLLNRLLDNVNHVHETRGNHVSYTWDVRTTDTDSHRFRPFCTVTRPLNILRVPYWVSPGLDRLEMSILCRVSNSNFDNGESVPYSDLPVDMRLSLGTETAQDDATELFPKLGGAYGGAWGLYKITHNVNSELLTQFGGRGGMSYLNLEIRSRTPAKIGADLNKNPLVEPYVIDYQSLEAESGGDYMKVTRDGFFDEGAASSAPVWDANEITCLGVIEGAAGENKELLSFHDPVFKWPGVAGRAMRVDGNLVRYTSESYGAKLVASYIQPISMQMYEVYR